MMLFCCLERYIVETEFMEGACTCVCMWACGHQSWGAWLLPGVVIVSCLFTSLDTRFNTS